MVRSIAVRMVLLLVISVPMFAQSNAQYCMGSGGTQSCQYLEDESFEGTPNSGAWYLGSGGYFDNVQDICAPGYTYVGAAKFPAGGYVYQNVVTDNFPYWRLRLDLLKPFDAFGPNDYLRVTVASYTTSEVHDINPGDYSGDCPIVWIPLTRNWGNQYISVKIQWSSTAYITHYVHVDRAGLFGSNIPN